jgi:beta-galactosidase
MHSGLLRHDESLDRGAIELRDLALVGETNEPVTAQVALLHDYDCLWVHEQQRHSADAGYWDQVMLFYTALRELGIDVDVRHPDDDLAGYAVVVAPALQIVSADRAQHFERIAGRSRLVFGPRTAFRTPTGRVHEDGQPGPLRQLLGWRLLNFDGLRTGLTVRANGHLVERWAESYRPAGGDVIAVYDDGPLAGQAAAIRRVNALTIGAWSSTMVKDQLRGILLEAGLEPIEMPDGVRRSRRGSRVIWCNFNEHPVDVSANLRLGPVSFGVTAE